MMDTNSSSIKIVPEHEMKSMLKERGIPVPTGSLCVTAEDALTAARGSYPVVVKLVSDAVLHKTELSGVRTGISNDDELKEVFTTMDSSFRKSGVPGYRGLLVEEMSPGGVEVIAGLSHDPVFGPVIMAGLGGIFTDVFKDVAFRLLPITAADALDMLMSLKGWPLLQGFRGSEPVDTGSLSDTIARLGALGLELSGQYDTMDFNPIIARADGCSVVDAKMVLRKSAPVSSDDNSPRNINIGGFFNPGSVAVVGASNTKDKIGNVILDSLINLDFSGAVYPINPSRQEIMGIKAYPSLSALPETPELVIFVVPLEAIPPALDEMGKMGSTNALIVSGGGRELGGGYAELESLIAEKGRENSIRIIGPNCIGSFDGHSRFDTFFYHRHRFERPREGSMSFITQSGTWGCSFMESAKLTGVSRMMSYGNRVDVDEGDLLSFLAGDPLTSVTGCYIEGLGNGRRFLGGVRESLVKGKPVVAFKTGRTRQSAAASVSHTGAYGGSYEIYRGVLEQHGVILTDSFHECLAGCEVLSMQPPAKGNRVALLSNGAGPMVNALDHFELKGLSLAELSPESTERMSSAFSYFYIVNNPVDVTGSASASDYELVIETLLSDDNVDIIMPFFVFQNTPLDESIIERMDALNKKHLKPIICCASEGEYSSKMSAELIKRRLPVYHEVITWVAGASAAARWNEIRKRFEGVKE